MVRRAASKLIAAATHLLPAGMASWSRAMARELGEIGDDRAALGFAAGCLRAAVALALAARLETLRMHIFQLVSPSTRRFQAMNHLLDHPRILGLLCAAGAVGSGLAYMAMAGAPPRYLLVNIAALVLGATAWLGLSRTASSRLAGNGLALLALALALLATALFGIAADGATRWVSAGPLSIQVSLIVLPPMIVLYARSADAVGTAGLAIAALALAAQPDRAMAGVLAAGLAVITLAKPGRLPAVALAMATAGFGATLLMPDLSPASPFVDGILYTAFGVHPLAGLAVVTGCFLLVLPALVGTVRSVESRHVLLAFGASWAGVVAAAAFGNYPTPLVGYSGSAVLGYLLSVALLPSGISDAAKTRKARSAAGQASEDDTIKFVAEGGRDREAIA